MSSQENLNCPFFLETNNLTTFGLRSGSKYRANLSIYISRAPNSFTTRVLVPEWALVREGRNCSLICKFFKYKVSNGCIWCMPFRFQYAVKKTSSIFPAKCSFFSVSECQMVASGASRVL